MLALLVFASWVGVADNILAGCSSVSSNGGSIDQVGTQLVGQREHHLPVRHRGQQMRVEPHASPAPRASAVLALTSLSAGSARSETAIGAVFGYRGNVGLSVRFDQTPVNAAWSSDFFHGKLDKWISKKNLGENLDWYWRPGIDAGIPLDDAEEFFLAARVPFGLQFMLTPKIETFGEIAPGFQFLDQTDFYWASNVGIRFALGN
jgi:hypothetical protein